MRDASPGKPVNKVKVPLNKDEDSRLQLARVTINPILRHASNSSSLVAQILAGDYQPSIEHDAEALKEAIARAKDGDKRFASELLAAQAVLLDAIFTEMMRRSVLNLAEYLDASERNMRLALKAQAGSRATLEALAKLHQPRKQTVKHVHVNEGGQAVVADQIHQHGAEWKIEQTILCNWSGWQEHRDAWPRRARGRRANLQR